MTQDELETAMAFHGHKCPAMPLGYRAAQAAMLALGVKRAQDKELHVISETGKGHAAGCFLDGIMSATGCDVPGDRTEAAVRTSTHQRLLRHGPVRSMQRTRLYQ